MKKWRIPDWLTGIFTLVPLIIAIVFGFAGATIGAFVFDYGIFGWVIGFGVGFVIGIGGISLS